MDTTTRKVGPTAKKSFIASKKKRPFYGAGIGN